MRRLANSWPTRRSTGSRTPWLGNCRSLRGGDTIGPYTIVQLLGSGGAGEVWRARDDRLRRDVAIKVLLPHVAERSRSSSPIRGGSARRRRPQSPEHPDGLRRRRARGHPVPGVRMPGRPEPASATGRRTDSGGGSAGDRAEHCSRSGRGARTRHRSPRSETGEHLPAAGRRREDPGLRPGEAPVARSMVYRQTHIARCPASFLAPPATWRPSR